MKCPNCGRESGKEEAECRACGLIFDKWLKKTLPARTAADNGAASAAGNPDRDWKALVLSHAYFYPAAAAAAIAFIYAFNFKSYLPVTEGWARVDSVLLPLSALTLVLHEAGHPLLGIFGSEFLMTAGGTIFQLAFPLAFFYYFFARGSKAGCFFAVFWTGYSLVNVSFYLADADVQALILITGRSGREGGLHDWNYLLGQLGLLKRCVGIARVIFFAGTGAMSFAPLAGIRSAWDALASKKPPDGGS